MKKAAEFLGGLLASLAFIAFGIWLFDPNDQSYHCGRGHCASGPAIALSAILVGAAALLFLVISAIESSLSERQKQFLGKPYRAIKRVYQMRKAPKYLYGKIPPRDEAAIDQAIEESRKGSKTR